MSKIIITLPLTYGRDAVERGLDVGTVVEATMRTITLSCTDRQFVELTRDCHYYRDPQGFDEDIQRTLCRSAQRAWRRIVEVRALRAKHKE